MPQQCGGVNGKALPWRSARSLSDRDLGGEQATAFATGLNSLASLARSLREQAS